MTRRPPRCAICGKPVLAAHAPFCSKRCKDIDLHRWLSGSYVIPGRDERPDRDQSADVPSPPERDRDERN